jgi:hypothetical protein
LEKEKFARREGSYEPYDVKGLNRIELARFNQYDNREQENRSLERARLVEKL